MSEDSLTPQGEIPVEEKKVEAFTVNPVYNKLADDQKLELLQAIEDWITGERKLIRGE